MKNLIAHLVHLVILLTVNSAYGQSSNIIRQDISPEVFQHKLKHTPHPQLIDVRTAEEYSEGHIKGALNIDVNKPDCISGFSKLNKRQAVFVYCLAGKRGEKATDILQSLGFREIYNMKGGIQEWINEKKPIEY